MEKGQEEEKRAAASVPCYKKKEGTGVLADMRDHLEQFKNTSAEKHWICLKNTARRAGDYVKQKKQTISVFGSSKIGAENRTQGKETANGSPTVQS